MNDEEEIEDWEYFAKNIKKLKDKKEVVLDENIFAIKKLRSSLKNKSYHNLEVDYSGFSYESNEIEFNKKHTKRIKSYEIDSRLDLHNYTLDAAYQALYRFIFGAYLEGKKSVLVITGKGEYVNGEYQGKIKQNITKWLTFLKHQGLVSAFSEAEESAGGAGAFRIILKK